MLVIFNTFAAPTGGCLPVMGNGKSLGRAGSGTREVVLCPELVDAGGAHRLLARDTWHLV